MRYWMLARQIIILQRNIVGGGLALGRRRILPLLTASIISRLFIYVLFSYSGPYPGRAVSARASATLLAGLVELTAATWC
ncbi:hypothetical protein BJX64DRAFT_68412 [Aspergillus heterothallicus]